MPGEVSIIRFNRGESITFFFGGSTLSRYGVLCSECGLNSEGWTESETLKLTHPERCPACLVPSWWMRRFQ